MGDSALSFAASSYSTSTIQERSFYTSKNSSKLSVYVCVLHTVYACMWVGCMTGVYIVRQMVKDICTFKKISLEEKDLERSAMDNWRYVFNGQCLRTNYVKGSIMAVNVVFAILGYSVQTRSKVSLWICF